MHYGQECLADLFRRLSNDFLSSLCFACKRVATQTSPATLGESEKSSSSIPFRVFPPCFLFVGFCSIAMLVEPKHIFQFVPVDDFSSPFSRSRRIAGRNSTSPSSQLLELSSLWPSHRSAKGTAQLLK